MSGVACATPVTPPHTIGTSDARLPVGEWLPRADGTSRQEVPGTVVRPKTPLQPDGTKNPGVVRGLFPFRATTCASPYSPVGEYGREGVKESFQCPLFRPFLVLITPPPPYGGEAVFWTITLKKGLLYALFANPKTTMIALKYSSRGLGACELCDPGSRTHAPIK